MKKLLAFVAIGYLLYNLNDWEKVSKDQEKIEDELKEYFNENA